MTPYIDLDAPSFPCSPPLSNGFFSQHSLLPYLLFLMNSSKSWFLPLSTGTVPIASPWTSVDVKSMLSSSVGMFFPYLT